MVAACCCPDCIYTRTCACVGDISGGFAADFFSFSIPGPAPGITPRGGVAGVDFSVMMAKNKFF